MENKRELYKQKYEAQLHEWSAKLEAMSAHADKLTADAKLEAKPHVDALRAKIEAAKAKLHELGTATDDKWDEAVKGADHLWEELKASVQGAFDAIQSDPKETPKKKPG